MQDYTETQRDFENFISSSRLDECFELLKNYIGRNFLGQEVTSLNNELIQYRRHYSDIEQKNRLGQFDYDQYNQQISKITASLIAFYGKLRPSEVSHDNINLYVPSVDKEWEDNKEDSVIEIDYGDRFPVLEKIFKDFIETQKQNGFVQKQFYYSEEGKRRKIDEETLNILDEYEMKNVSNFDMIWKDAVIIQKKYDENPSCKALIRKKGDKVVIKVKGYMESKLKLIADIVVWFQNAPYATFVSDPFKLNIPYNSVSLMYGIWSDETER